MKKIYMHSPIWREDLGIRISMWIPLKKNAWGFRLHSIHGMQVLEMLGESNVYVIFGLDL